jgi:rare lipoprotein A
MARGYSVWTLFLLCISCSAVDYRTVRNNRYTRTLGTATKEYSGKYKVGKPYKVFGKEYHPEENNSYQETGVASWYGEGFHSRKTANGDTFDMHQMTAAHRTLPMPSIVKVTNIENGRTALLLVNDRGPFVNNRIIDVSRKAAEKLGFLNQGVARVRVEFREKETKKFLKSTNLKSTN